MTERKTPLDLEPEVLAEAGHRLVDDIAGFLASMRTRPVPPDVTPEVVRSALGSDRPLPEEGTDTAELMGEALRTLAPHSTFNGHPRFFGYITGAPAPSGMLADFLASALNPNRPGRPRRAHRGRPGGR